MEGVAKLWKLVKHLRKKVDFLESSMVHPEHVTQMANLNYVYNPSTGLWHEIQAIGPDGNVTPQLDQFGVAIVGATVLVGSQTIVGFANLAALRASVNHLSNQVVEVLGYNSPGDGGQGQWYFDSTSMKAPISGLVELPDDIPVANPGRWIKL